MIATIRAEWRKNQFRPAFLVPDIGKAIHGYDTVPSIIAEVWTLGYLLVIGVNTKKSDERIVAASS